MLVMSPTFAAVAVRRAVLAAWFAFLVAVIAFVSGVAAWIWLVFGAGRW